MCNTKLNLPAFEMRHQLRDGREEIFDFVRQIWVLNTPEEYVRQHLLHYLIEQLEVPRGLLAVEMPIKVNGMDRRCDIVIYTNSGKPKMIVECKAPTVKITQKAVDQAGSYNLTLKTPFLLISNGLQHYSFSIDYRKQETQMLNFIPDYTYLLTH
ncbi:MAG: type I restriction enzyme HsdR N-terminal domain-containing protein [Salinivirgaceae bacterium]